MENRRQKVQKKEDNKVEQLKKILAEKRKLVEQNKLAKDQELRKKKREEQKRAQEVLNKAKLAKEHAQANGGSADSGADIPVTGSRSNSPPAADAPITTTGSVGSHNGTMTPPLSARASDSSLDNKDSFATSTSAANPEENKENTPITVNSEDL